MTADALGLVGTVVDQVRFDACVDSGGFGLVYKAYHQGLAETVAVKCMRLPAIKMTDAIRETLVARFRDETRIMYRLSQGNLDIVRSMSSGTLVSPTTRELVPYMVLEWLEGHTLSAELKRRREGKLPPRSLEETVGLLDSAAGALAYAHTQGVVHRDVKPGNLFITKVGGGERVKVLDFGLAKILTDDALGFRGSVETQAGTHFCSPSYGAPEQFSKRSGPIGAWTDVYSFALVMLECMTGSKVRPAGSLAEGLMMALDAKTGSPSPTSLGLKLPQGVEQVLLRAVALETAERPKDMGAFWTDLKAAMASAGNEADLLRTVMQPDLDAAMAQVREAIAKRDSLAPPPNAQAQGAPPGAPALKDLKATMPIGALSPLAVSGLGPGAQQKPAPAIPPAQGLSPIAVGGGGQGLQIMAPQQPQGAPYAQGAPPHGAPRQGAPGPAPLVQGPASVPPRAHPSVPPPAHGHASAPPGGSTSQSMSVTSPPKSSGPLVFAIVFFVMLALAGAGGAVYWFKLRGG